MKPSTNGLMSVPATNAESKIKSKHLALLSNFLKFDVVHILERIQQFLKLCFGEGLWIS
jgi:hypothetical protein